MQQITVLLIGNFVIQDNSLAEIDISKSTLYFRINMPPKFFWFCLFCSCFTFTDINKYRKHVVLKICFEYT